MGRQIKKEKKITECTWGHHTGRDINHSSLTGYSTVCGLGGCNVCLGEVSLEVSAGCSTVHAGMPIGQSDCDRTHGGNTGAFARVSGQQQQQSSSDDGGGGGGVPFLPPT